MLVSLMLLFGCPTQEPAGGDRVLSAAPGSPDTGTLAPSPLHWIDVDMGYQHACGVLSDGRALCWGDEETVQASEAVAPVDAVSVRASSFEGCALREGGQVVCWCKPTAPPHSLSICDDAPVDTSFVRIEIGTDFGCGQRPDLTLRCWGARSTFEASDVPSEAVADWDVDAGGGCALLDAGRLECWGGQGWREAPPADVQLVRIGVGWNHACGLDAEGGMHCWGYSGVIDETGQWPFPDAPTGTFVDLFTEADISCGLRANGEAVCVYDHPFLNDLDDPIAEADGTPSWTPPDRTWTRIGLGEWNGCGLTTEGDALCWPSLWNQSGQNDVPSLESLGR